MAKANPTARQVKSPYQPRMMPAFKGGRMPTLSDAQDAVADGLENAGGPKDAPDADDARTND